MDAKLSLRLATADDIDFVTAVIDTVSEGVVENLFAGFMPGKSGADMLAIAFGRSMEPYAPENVILAELGGKIVGMCFAYDVKHQQIPALMESFLGAKRINPVRPLLTASFPDALWVNTLWTDASVRGRGLGQLMIRAAESRAREAGLKCLALNCWADNSRGQDFYAKAGFTEKGRIPLAGKVAERHPAGGILLVKPLEVAA